MADDASLAFVSEYADGGGIEGQNLPGERRESDPAGGENAQDMAVGEEGDIGAGGGCTGNDLPGAGGDLFERFAIDHRR